MQSINATIKNNATIINTTIKKNVTTKGDNKKTQPNKSQQHKNYYYRRSCIFRTSRANKPLRFDQQKPLVTDQQN